MRALTLLALLAIATVPAASAGPSQPVTVDPYAEVGGDCDTCAEASLSVVQDEPDNCADCAYVWGTVAVETDGRGAAVDAEVCRGGFVVICVVDQRVEV